MDETLELDVPDFFQCLIVFSSALVPLAIDEQVEASSVQKLKSCLSPKTSHDSIVDNSNSVAKHISFFH